MIDYEEMALESNLFPWLDSDCMSDDFFDELSYFEDEEDFEWLMLPLHLTCSQVG